jgi:single-stranded-DNA-specific exonuclease
MEKQWHIHRPNRDLVRHLSRTLGCDPVVATVLANRNICSEKDASRFLNPSLNDIRPPFAIKDIDAASNRIYEAVIRNEKILIFGDYDVDGITATAVLLEFLRYTGARVSYYIPHRLNEGYGLQTDHVTNHAVPNNIGLIITVDCGSTSHEAVLAARNAGIDTVITDHHQTSDRLPEALAVVNPARPDCTAGFHHLAGVGVAFYLLINLRKFLREKGFWENRPEPKLVDFFDLVALGTVADMVPLFEENRILARIGTHRLSRTNRPGITALLDVSGIGEQVPDAEDIAFRLAPRINAVGRLGHAAPALELLTTRNADEGKRLADYLNKMNRERQEIESRVFDTVSECLSRQSHLTERRTIVLSHPDWHEGVLGIAASRILKTFYRPVVLISTRGGMGKGSARSISGIDLYASLKSCGKYLDSFGGHRMAAGLKLKTENIEKFCEAFERTVAESTRADNFVPTLSIDCELDFDGISSDLIDNLESIKPFGSGNPEPIFMARNIKVASSKIVGGTHRRMTLKQLSGKSNAIFNAIQFNIDPQHPLVNTFDRMAFRLHWNRWNGQKKPQIVVEET